MTKIQMFFILFTCIFSSAFVHAKAGEEIDAFYRRKLVSFFTDEKKDDTINILLSDGSMWRLKFSFEDDSTLYFWNSDDEIYIHAKQKSGFELLNISNYTSVYASPSNESLKLFPVISKIDCTPGGWFERDKYVVHLSDGSAWETWLPISARWKLGQKVLISNSHLARVIVNLQLPYMEGYINDRFYEVNLRSEHSTNNS